jgi:hypothetical protein
MVNGFTAPGNLDRFAPPPWTCESVPWIALDQHLPVDHLARRVARAVEHLDLTALWNSYYGVGKRALRPDLLLRAVLYEMQNKRPSPAQWAKDVCENEPVRWLLFGMEQSWSARRIPMPPWHVTRKEFFDRCIRCRCCAISIRP